MKTYKTTNGGTIKKVGREKKIYMSERPYFMWGEKRQHLDEIPRLSYPIMYEDENGKISPIGGYCCITNCYGVLIELTADGEAVQIWEELD